MMKGIPMLLPDASLNSAVNVAGVLECSIAWLKAAQEDTLNCKGLEPYSLALECIVSSLAILHRRLRTDIGVLRLRAAKREISKGDADEHH